MAHPRSTASLRQKDQDPDVKLEGIARCAQRATGFPILSPDVLSGIDADQVSPLCHLPAPRASSYPSSLSFQEFQEKSGAGGLKPI